jgi:hypothetical protein
MPALSTSDTERLEAALSVLNRREVGQGLAWRERVVRARIVRELRERELRDVLRRLELEASMRPGPTARVPSGMARRRAFDRLARRGPVHAP